MVRTRTTRSKKGKNCSGSSLHRLNGTQDAETQHTKRTTRVVKARRDKDRFDNTDNRQGDFTTATASKTPAVVDEKRNIENGNISAELSQSPSSSSSCVVALQQKKLSTSRKLDPRDDVTRRLECNERERLRMGKLNTAYNELRDVLPIIKNPGREISKLETLIMAKEYINALLKNIDFIHHLNPSLTTTMFALAEKGALENSSSEAAWFKSSSALISSVASPSPSSSSGEESPGRHEQTKSPANY